MPKNKGKGGKNRKKGRNENDDEINKRELVYKEEGQEYAQVMKMTGGGYFEATCFDGKRRACHIRGTMRKKVWINVGDIVLVGLRDFEDSKADVILKYTAEEARRLRSYGELPDSLRIADGRAHFIDDGVEDGVIFADEDAEEYEAQN